MLGYAVESAGGPLTVTMPAQIYRIDVKLFAQRSCYPVPVASVIQSPVNQNEGRLSFIAPNPRSGVSGGESNSSVRWVPTVNS